MKCADIPDDVFLAAVTETPPMHPGMTWRSRWAVHDTLQARLGVEIPEKLALAKARKLIQAKKLAGCACGCRGDYRLPGEG